MTRTELPDTLLVAGVDGCPRGWIIVIAMVDAERMRLESILVTPSFKDMLAATLTCAAVGVDIPIGLSDGEPRLADIEARWRLGRGRASSVFPPPVRAALYYDDYREACDASAAACGKMLSKQAFNIKPKIREADDALFPNDQARVVEAHPELCFWALNGGRPMAHNKKTVEGATERRAVLSSVFGEDVSLRSVPRGSGRDDFYDACVLAWTASRLARGIEMRLPEAPQRDGRGLRMEIVY